MQPFPLQDDTREARLVARLRGLMRSGNNAETETELKEWIKYVLTDLESRGPWWFLTNVATADLAAGDDIIDLVGDVEKVERIFCPAKLNKASLSSITEARTVAIANASVNAGEPSAYALEAGKRVHLWPAPNAAVKFAVQYQRTLALEIVPSAYWEMVVFNGVIAYFGQHFDRDALTQNIGRFESRYESQINRARKESYDVEIVGYTRTLLEASGIVVANSATDTAIEHIVPASMGGVGHEYILTVS